MQREDQNIEITGARVHNLKNISVTIPRQTLTVVTGLSGSGKSSLAFDTIFAEGQRRYIETFSAYARNFLGNIERPDVDNITGLSPVISIEQKTTHKNPRSTVGTITEIYDYLRLLYARASTPYSSQSGTRMERHSEEQILDMIVRDYAGRRIYLLSPLVRQRKGHYRELFESMRRKGYLHIFIDGEMHEIVRGMKTDRYKNHNIEVVIDRLQVDANNQERLRNSMTTALRQGEGTLMVMADDDRENVRHFSKRLMDPTTGLSYSDAAPNMFSFNSPEGACPRCKGLGYINEIDPSKVIPQKSLSIYDGAITPLGKYKNQMIFWQIESILQQYQCTLKTPVSDIPTEAMEEILHGTLRNVRIAKELVHTSNDYFLPFDGIIKYLQTVMENDGSSAAKKWADQFKATCTCPQCNGKRLKPESLAWRIGTYDISQIANMEINQLRPWLDQVPDLLAPMQQKIANPILKEIRTRTDFLLQVGLDYLSLNRPAATLSGGESQRIRLATQVASQLVNVLYILDEPSIGLHQRDNQRLIQSLRQLRDIGNTVIVVEHDRDMMLAADYIVDIGPRAGLQGGEVVFQGTPQQMLCSNTLTAHYLRTPLEMPPHRRRGNGHILTIKGACGNNLRNIDANFPLGTLTVVTGVSGSGKSTLVNDTLHPILAHLYHRAQQSPLPYESVLGTDALDKVVCVDQSPIGRTPRSNPATYTGVFGDIRQLFASLPEAKIRGYKAGRFSFNVGGGRCDQCGGNGCLSIEMNFLPDVAVPCPQCHGKRYNRETLEVRYKGKSISDILNMTIGQATEFFASQPAILQKIKTLNTVGLGYLTLGQAATTLSGGESQRVKLATELARRDTGRTLYILDEPTTGLHSEDIRVLMQTLQQLVDKGNTVIMIEHNMDVILQADHIIDMGPEGGRNGGCIVATGTPEEISRHLHSHTARYIRESLQLQAI